MLSSVWASKDLLKVELRNVFGAKNVTMSNSQQLNCCDNCNVIMTIAPIFRAGKRFNSKNYPILWDKGVKVTKIDKRCTCKVDKSTLETEVFTNLAPASSNEN